MFTPLRCSESYSARDADPVKITATTFLSVQIRLRKWQFAASIVKIGVRNQ